MARSSVKVFCILDSARFIKLPFMMLTSLSQITFYLFEMYPHSLKSESEILHVMYSRHWTKNIREAALKASETEDQYYL